MQLTKEIYSMAFCQQTTHQYLCVNFWNTSSVRLYDTKRLIESSGSVEDQMFLKIEVEEYAPFNALEIVHMKVF